ncbi:competence type IV pilus ATPase ComGA [Ornithinibacillus halophilus]|uniref:Competence-related pilin export protein ComGA n=1 Tax=Ornithinibacillus halophilus TaxID=930117 RepID=A0A1M5D172_9BACI|nr:competence type IV pilus ATPase ComGA [Ornithinibacillus halophilus]SHF60630.1 competence-related pilin export protein ComGA [Ornithinibacillus halophilus]
MNDTELLSLRILNTAIKKNASDIHFYPFPDKTKIYFRILGKRIYMESIDTKNYNLLLTYYKFTSGMDIGETRKPQDGIVTHQDPPKTYSLRLSTLPISQLESLAIRILPQEKNLPIDQLFLFSHQLTTLKKWIKNQSGIILLTGPTGSGKTTTLYALLDTIRKESSYQTITLEDPVEKRIQDVLQVQVNEKAGITYQTGLKAALRHDPDVIMVGEIRDKFTAQFAFDASLTGHLVLSTLHAKNTKGTIHRLLEMGISQPDLKQSLIGVASIELLPIQLNNQIIRRAAILEMMDSKCMENLLKGETDFHYNTFQHLRRKAYAYGYITKDTYTQLLQSTK